MADEPAFPTLTTEEWESGRHPVTDRLGLSKREWYAGQAPPLPEAILKDFVGHAQTKPGADRFTLLDLMAAAAAEWAVVYADNLLVRLEKKA